MRTEIELWTVQDLYDAREDINEQPSYQRGEVWKDAKKSLLIDSMLRGIEMPKIFLNKMRKGAYNYEVADGQQRINSIIKFKNDTLQLRDDKVLGLDLNVIGNEEVGKMNYSQLPKKLRDKFDNYLLTVAIIEDATGEEIRTLFGRLQLGETLKPAEKRNAIVSVVGNHINSIALNHDFFIKSKIKKERYNRQDYLAHAFTLVAYNNSADLKAELIQKTYLDEKLKWPLKTIKKVTDVLEYLASIDENSKKRIVNKFTFIDLFWFLYKEYGNYTNIDHKGFGNHYDLFEKRRLENYANPEKLLSTGKIVDKNLYRYITAYRYEGAKVTSIDNRSEIINREFKQFLV